MMHRLATKDVTRCGLRLGFSIMLSMIAKEENKITCPRCVAKPVPGAELENYDEAIEDDLRPY